jgi:hypothetical protein
MKSLHLTMISIAVVLLTSCERKLPRPDHIIVVIEENHGYDEVINSPNAPFITQLAKEGALFTDAHGVIHPSQPNYLAIYSGSTQGVTGDTCLGNETPFTTPNLGAALISKGYTFEGFAQSMPVAGYQECEHLKSSLTGASLYGRKHCPWINWQGDEANNIPASVSLMMSSFPEDFNQLPTVAFVIPDMDHDMHNIGAPGDAAAVQRGDQWLKENLAAYVQWAKTHNSLLIVTFDEDDFRLVNHIPTIFAGAMVKPGKYDEHVNHYTVLHTIEEMYDLPVADSTNAGKIKDIWTTQ